MFSELCAENNRVISIGAYCKNVCSVLVISDCVVRVCGGKLEFFRSLGEKTWVLYIKVNSCIVDGELRGTMRK